MNTPWANIGLKPKFLMAATFVYLVTGLVAFAVSWSVIGKLTERLGLAYAGKYALASSAVLQEPLDREIALARLMADSPIIGEWVMSEADDAKRAKALAELDSYQERFADRSWFLIFHSSLHYYFDNSEHRYGPSKFAYSLNPAKNEDQWYFATMKDVPDFALNVNYDNVLDAHKVWINVVMRGPDGQPIGLAGSGLDLSKFLRATVDSTETGVETVILDRRMAIQAYKDRALIDQHSITKPSEALSRVDRLLDNPDDLGAVQAAFERLKKGANSETFFVTMRGKRCIAGAAYVPSLDWYVLTALDLDQVIGRYLFAPLLVIGAALTVLLFAMMEILVNRMVLRPIATITAAAKRISDGDYAVDLSSERRDVIGTLARTFNEMKEKVRGHAEDLEQRIKERTSELHAANLELQENMKRLEDALASVRTLEGILPICASCKKIRDDKGYWTQVEAYVSERSSAEFSHGLCPECMKKLYPEVHKGPDDGSKGK